MEGKEVQIWIAWMLFQVSKQGESIKTTVSAYFSSNNHKLQLNQ